MESELEKAENTATKTEEERDNTLKEREDTKKTDKIIGNPFKAGDEWKGNKNGRPKGSRNLTKIFELAMHEVKERAKVKGTVIEDPEIEIMLSLLTQAQKGNVRAMELYMKYKYGNPTQPIDLSGNLKAEGIEESIEFFKTLIAGTVEGKIEREEIKP